MKTLGQTLVINSVWSLLNQVTRVGTMAIVMIALSRHFGPERFGTLAFGFAFVRIFAVIAAFGLDRILVRHLAECTGDPSAILRGAFRLKFFIALGSYLALMVTVWAFDPRDRLMLTIVLLAGAGLLFQPFDVFDYAFQAQSRFRLTFLGRALPLLVGTGLKIGAILAGAPLLAFAFLETLEAALIGGALIVIYRKIFGRQPRIDSASINWHPILAQGIPLLLSSLAILVYMRTDVLMLGKLAGYQASGIYSAAAQVAEACTLVSVAVTPVLFPILLRWRASGLAFYHRQFEKLFLVAFLAGLAIALLLSVCAPMIIGVLFGSAFLPAVNVLRILAWAPMFVFVGVTQSGYDITEGLTWMATLRIASGAVINIGLNLFLIPRFGAGGAAAATVAAQGWAAFVSNALHPQTRPVFFSQLKALRLFPRSALPPVEVSLVVHSPCGREGISENETPTSEMLVYAKGH